jgi:putative ABC transport system substrate-binding protein
VAIGGTRNCIVDKMLRGAKPGDIPVERATVFEFVVNVKTTRALRLTIPPEVAAQVTHWIE